jgi:hypothetical protein
MPRRNWKRRFCARLGVDLGSKASLGEAIERRNQRRWRSPLPPTIFLTAGNDAARSRCLAPASHNDARATLRIQLEDGGQVEREVALGEILAGQRLRLPDDLPLGYHEMTLEIPGENLAALAPDCVPEPGF